MLHSYHYKKMEKQIRLQLLNDEYEKSISETKKWKSNIYENYIKREQYLIFGMLAYLENIERGFGKYNDEKLYRNIRKNDTSGRLYAETLHGFQISKIYISIAPVLWQIKSQEMLSRSYGSNLYL